MKYRFLSLLLLLLTLPVFCKGEFDPTTLDGDVIMPSVEIITLDLTHQNNFVVGDSFTYIVTLKNSKNEAITPKVYTIILYDPSGEAIDESKYLREVNSSSEVTLRPEYFNQAAAPHKIFDFKQTGIYRIKITSDEMAWFTKRYNWVDSTHRFDFVVNPTEYNYYFEVISYETFSQREENRRVSNEALQLAQSSNKIALIALVITLFVALIELAAHKEKRKIVFLILKWLIISIIIFFILVIFYVLLKHYAVI